MIFCRIRGIIYNFGKKYETFFSSPDGGKGIYRNRKCGKICTHMFAELCGRKEKRVIFSELLKEAEFYYVHFQPAKSAY